MLTFAPWPDGADGRVPRQLCLLEVPSASALPDVLGAPSPRFVALVIWDSESHPVEELSRVADVLLDSGAAYVCTFGAGCERLHNVVDNTLVMRELEDERWDQRFVMTTWHSDETLRNALWFWLNTAYPDDSALDGCESALVVLIGADEQTRAEAHFAAASPRKFTDQVLKEEP